jgi:holo-[acyl-carrier protein] synthase
MTMTNSIDLADMVGRLIHAGMAPDGVRLGVDVVDIRVLTKQMSGPTGQRFLAAQFTPAELSDSRGRSDRIAARWAAKEAVAKAIGTGFRGLKPAMIEVVKAADGQPSIRAVGDCEWPYQAHEWRWAISLAHDGNVAIAVAMALNVRASEILQTASTPPRRSRGSDQPSE